jgi:enoyl-CoA hydratase
VSGARGGAPSELVLLEDKGGVATITLNSPERRNALSQAMMAAVVRALDEVAADDSVRVVVLTHNGPVFSAGVDLKEAAALGMEAGTRALLGLLRAIVALPKPVIARIDGTVRAGGLGIVGACDVAVSVDTVTFAFTEARLGLAPAIISLTTLPWMTPRPAHRWCLTGETFDAAAAAAAGLVSQAVPSADLDATVSAVTAELLAASPQGLAETKRLLTRGVLARIDAEGEEILALSSGLFASEEAREGMNAFLERRPPRWAITN